MTNTIPSPTSLIPPTYTEDMEDEQHHIPHSSINGGRHSNVDTSRPFTSVREAVAIFGQRITLPGQTDNINTKPVSPSASSSISQVTSLPSSPWKQRFSLPSSPQGAREEFMDVLKKLEAEITETRTEVRMLKEKESETEVAVATLNAELQKNMIKLAKAEADAAEKSTVAEYKTVSFKEVKERGDGEEERRKEIMKRMEKEYPTLAQILDSNKGDKEGYFGKTKKNDTKKKKKKPIVPLVGDFFSCKKKGSSTEISGPFCISSSSLRF